MCLVAKPAARVTASVAAQVRPKSRPKSYEKLPAPKKPFGPGHNRFSWCLAKNNEKSWGVIVPTEQTFAENDLLDESFEIPFCAANWNFDFQIERPRPDFDSDHDLD